MVLAIDYSKWDKLVLSDSDDDSSDHGLRAVHALRSATRDGGRGLREFALAAQRAKAVAYPPRVCYVGGSVTAQVEGWRPRFHSLLEKHLGLSGGSLGHTLSAMGNVGSKVLAFLLEDWILSSEADLVFIETVINDGDSLLEDGGTTGAEAAVRRALEGIIRGIRATLPRADIVLVMMFLRKDLATARRTGTKAWADGDVVDAAEYYHRRVPHIYNQLAAHYGLATISLIEDCLRRTPDELDRIFRDDCHHTEFGAAAAAYGILDGVRDLLAQGRTSKLSASPPLGTFPTALDPRHWSGGKAYEILAEQITLHRPGGTMANAQQIDRDPIAGNPTAWWRLRAGDKCCINFRGTGLALLTYVGPDSPTIQVTLTLSSKETKTLSLDLFDQWCYYWRLSVFTIASELPKGCHQATIRVVPHSKQSTERAATLAPAEAKLLKRPIPKELLEEDGARQCRLWLSYSLVMSASGIDMPVIAAKDPGRVETLGRCQPQVSVAPPRKPG